MKTRSIVILVMVGLFAFLGCKNTPSKAEQTYRKNLKVVLDGHDELMEKQSTMMHLLKQINEYTKNADDTLGLKAAGIHLEVAMDDMFDWMKDLTEDFDDFHGNKEKPLSDEEYEKKIEKLKVHKKRLSDLEEQFDRGIAEAKAALEKVD